MLKSQMIGSASRIVYARAPETGSKGNKGKGSEKPVKAEPAELINDVDILNAVRDAFSKAVKRDLRISNATLDLIMEKAGDKWDAMSAEETIQFLVKSETEVAKVSVSDTGILALVSKLERDTEFNNELDTCIEATIRSKTTAVDVYGQFKRIYTREELDGMAWPGTKSDSEFLPNTNKSRRADIVTKTAANGDEITTKWVEDFVGKHPKGAAYDANISAASKEKKSSGSIPSLRHLGMRDLDSIIKDNTTRRNAFRSMVRRAISTHHALSQIEGMPKVVLEFKPTQDPKKYTLVPAKFGTGKHADDDLKVTLSSSPFWMYPKGDAGSGKPFSVTQIINMDCDVAIAAGGAMADLTATLKTGSDDPEGTGDGADMDTDEAGENLSKAVNYFNIKDNRAAVSRILAKKRKGTADEKKAADDMMENISDLFNLLAPFVRKNRDWIRELKGAEVTAPEEGDLAGEDVEIAA